MYFTKSYLYSAIFVHTVLQALMLQAAEPTKKPIPKEILSKVLIENLSKELSYLDRNRGPIKIFKRRAETILALNPLKKIYAVVFPDSSTLFLKEIETGKTVQILKGDESRPFFASFSPDAEKIAALNQEGVMKVWKVSSGDLLQTFSEKPVQDFTWSPNGENILMSTGGSMKMWHVSSGKELKTFLFGYRPFAFSPDGNRVAALTMTHKIGIWDVPSENVLALTVLPVDLEHIGDTITKLSFSLDGKKLCFGTFSGAVELWEIATKRKLFSFKGHKGTIRDILMSPDNKTIFTSSDDGTVKQWDMQSGEELKTLSGIEYPATPVSMAFSQGGEASHLYVLGIDLQGTDVRVIASSIYLFDLSSKPFDWLTFHIDARQALLIETAYRAKMANNPLKLDSAGYKILMEIEDPTIRAFLVNSFSIQLPEQKTQ